MTDQELKDIVAAVVAELEKSGVDFDYKAEPAEDGDLVFVIRGTAPNYQGVTVTWESLLDIIISQATQAKNDAETAKNAANTILEQVQSKGTEITNFVATSKAELETQKNESVNAVKSVYQNDLDELKGDLSDIETSSTNLFNPAYFLEVDGFSRTNDGISAQATKFANAFGSAYYPFDEGIVFEEDTQYTLSFKTKTDGSQQTTSNGLLVYIYHTDGTEVHESIPNSTSTFVTITKTSTRGKTVAGIKFSYIQGGNNT